METLRARRPDAAIGSFNGLSSHMGRILAIDYGRKRTGLAVTDPLQIIVTSTGGDVFKNGQGTTVLTAVCYQAGSEVDAAGNGSYTWTKYNKDGVVDTSWGTNGSKTGKTLSVSSADVDTKATFMVVVAL